MYCSTKQTSLPTPSLAEQQQSAALSGRIREEITRYSGIPFSRFMEMTLYTPELGYYCSPRKKFGSKGDFVTAPELSPLFSVCLAKQCAEVFSVLPKGQVLELGAGSGRMAGTILNTLVVDHAFTGQYYILEPSGYLKQQQQSFLAETQPESYHRFVWLDTLPNPNTFEGVILANEVIDAMPVERFLIQEKTAYRYYVECDNNHNFVWQPRENDLAPLAELSTQLRSHHSWPIGTDYTSEYHPQLSAWVAAMANAINQGVMFILDYGFPQQTFYHPSRAMGTLMCHYRHYAHSDPFFFPGLQDITAHVDFSALRAAAERHALACLGYTHQASFLIDLGILSHWETYQTTLTDPQRIAALQAIQVLLSPSEMGEFIKVMALGKSMPAGLPSSLKGFARDMQASLI